MPKSNSKSSTESHNETLTDSPLATQMRGLVWVSVFYTVIGFAAIALILPFAQQTGLGVFAICIFVVGMLLSSLNMMLLLTTRRLEENQLAVGRLLAWCSFGLVAVGGIFSMAMMAS